MNPEELARLYHKTLNEEVAPRHDLAIRSVLWEDLSETTRTAMKEVAQVVLDNIQTPFIGTPEKPRVSYTIDDRGDQEFNAIVLIDMTLNNLSADGAVRVMDFIRSKQFERERANLMAPMNTAAPMPTEMTHND